MIENFLTQESNEYCAPVCEVINFDYDCEVLLDSSTSKSTINDWYEDDEILSM